MNAIATGSPLDADGMDETEPERVIRKLGGVAADVARAAKVQPPAVWKWRQRGRVPPQHIPNLLRYAREHGYALLLSDFDLARDVGDG